MSPIPHNFTGTSRFTIIRSLGAGSFGAVYEVADTTLQTRVALKVLRRTDADLLYRFKQEFRSLSRTAHPNLVSLYELFSENEHWFFTMELVDGVDFRSYTSGTTPDLLSTASEVSHSEPVGQTTDITIDIDDHRGLEDDHLPGRPSTMPADPDRLRHALAQLADGLGYLHGTGKLHRDIKASNVLVTHTGQVKLLDFGLVRDVEPLDGTESQVLAGTPVYMSPEQLFGDSMTPAADWYAVGVLLFRALTGRYPFSGPLANLISQKQAEHPYPRDVTSDVPDDLNELCHDLLTIDPSRRPDRAEVLARLGSRTGERLPTPDVATPHPSTPRLVGRGDELRQLTDAYERSLREQATTVYVRGASGIGKSTLVRQFLRQVKERHPDTLILSGRCYEREWVPYKALDGLVDSLSRHLDVMSFDDLAALLPRDTAALARLFPVLRRVATQAMPGQPVRRPPDSKELRRRAFAAFRKLIDRLRDRRPVVLFIDDLQWGDADSAAVLVSLLRPPDPPPVLLLTAYRSEEADRISLRSLLEDPEIGEGVETREIEVSELSDDEAHALALQLMEQDGHARVSAETIVRETRGNPFLIEELSRYAVHLRAHASDDADATGTTVNLDTLISTRLTALPESARRLLQLLAVFGRPLSLTVARRAATLAAEELNALSILRAGHLVRIRAIDVGEELETYHDRIRETVVNGMPADQLVEHHRALAHALEAQEQPDPETLAVHHHGAGDDKRAARYAGTAAEQALTALAFDRAVRLYRLALDMASADDPDQQRLLIGLGDALGYAGRGAESADAYRSAAKTANTTLTRLELRRRAGEQLLRSGHIDDGMAEMDSVLRSVGMRLDLPPWRSVASILWHRALIWVTRLRFRERHADELAGLDLFRVDACWSVALHVGNIDTIRGADFQARHLWLALRLGELGRVTRAVATEVGYSAMPGSRAAAPTQKVVQRAHELADRLGDRYAHGLVYLAHGFATNMCGRWTESLALAERAEELLRDERRSAWELNLVAIYSLINLQYVGDFPEFERRFRRFMEDARERDDVNAITNLQTRLAYPLHLAADDPEQARDEVTRGMQRWSRRGFQLQHYYELFAQTEIALYCGEGTAAHRAVEAKWTQLKRSLLMQSQIISLEARQLRARAAVCAAGDATSSNERNAALRIAARHVGQLQKVDVPWMRGPTALVQTGVAVTSGASTADVIRHLEVAERASKDADMLMHAAAAKRRRGRLLGRVAGAELVREADAWMTTHNVADPERMTCMVAPGAYGVGGPA